MKVQNEKIFRIFPAGLPAGVGENRTMCADGAINGQIPTCYSFHDKFYCFACITRRHLQEKNP
jgi:hypothetical protein